VRNAQALMGARQDEAAFLLLWSALEGALRLAGERAQLPLASLPPSTLIRELYSAGEISREQFDALLGLLPIRNQLVHGFGLDQRLMLSACVSSWPHCWRIFAVRRTS
jgi:hypothetical protein